jgi:hydroxymethylpyrimidine pyrophosphatase-like HAD family hydrolase
VSPKASSRSARSLGSKVKVVCMDMDGTLLNSQSKLTRRTADTLRRVAAETDVRLLVATGKARPAVVSAFEGSGLVGALRYC